MNWDDVLRPGYRSGGGYEKDEAPADLVLDANERTTDIPEEIKRNCLDRLLDEPWNLYPDVTYESLRSAWASYLQVEPDQVVPGNGSDEIISYLMTVCLEPGDRVLMADPTFSMYRILAEQHHASVREVPFAEDWSLPEEFFVEAEQASLVFVGSPNNPTGDQVPRATVLELMDRCPGLVVLDEAYVEFCGGSLVSLVQEQHNLAVLRTLSKAFGLAAIRVGAVVAPVPLREALEAARLPYNINRLSCAVAAIGLNQADRLLEYVDEVTQERKRVARRLTDFGLQPGSSDANFLLFRAENAEQLYRELIREGVRIRSFDHPRLTDYFRVTIGDRDTNDRFLSALEAAVNSL